MIIKAKQQLIKQFFSVVCYSETINATFGCLCGIKLTYQSLFLPKKSMKNCIIIFLNLAGFQFTSLFRYYWLKGNDFQKNSRFGTKNVVRRYITRINLSKTITCETVFKGA